MPGIFVEARDEDILEVKMPYFHPYLKRIRKIDGARWGGDDDPAWLVPMESAEDLDDEFYDEIIYKTPRHEILEDVDPPKPPAIFKEVKKRIVKDLNIKPYDFQQFGINFLAHSLKKQGTALLGDLMGTGKTFQSMAAALQLKQEGLVKKVLVVVLAPTRTQWQQEIRKFTQEDSVLFADFKAKYKQKDGKRYISETIEDQKIKAIDDFMKGDEMFLVMSYQGLQQNVELIEKASFDMMIMDEAHYVKNRTAKTNRAAKRIVTKRTPRHKMGENHGIKYTLFVSGTPIMNYPDELYGLISIANEKIFGKWRDFRKKHCTLNDDNDVMGYKLLSEIRDIILQFLIRRTDKEIGMSLPQIVEKDVYIDPHEKQIKLDKALVEEQKEVARLLHQEKNSAKKIALEGRMRGIPNMRIAAGCHPNTFQLAKSEKIREKYKNYAFKKDKLRDIPKFDRCLEMVEEIVDSGYKVVVFVNSRRMTILLHKEISKFTRAVRYVGGLDNKTRERRKHLFNNDPRCRVMIANSAGSTGLNLQAGRYLINYDLPHTAAEWEQRKYRIRRLDSTHDKVFITNLINRGLYDETLREKIVTKQASFDAMIENSEETTAFHQKQVKTAKRKKRKKRKRKPVDLEGVEIEF